MSRSRDRTGARSRQQGIRDHPGSVAGPVQASRGFVFEGPGARQDAYVPKLDEVKDKVRDAVIAQKARELSRQKAAEIAARLKAAADFDKAAKAAGVEVKSTDFIAREAPIPDLGDAPAVEDAAFKMAAGTVSDAIVTDTGAAIIKVLEKQTVTPEEWASAKARFREEVLSERATASSRLHGEGQTEDEDRREPRNAPARVS